jgi:hypothetical protein
MNEAFYAQLYIRTRNFWEARKGKYPTWDCGYRILYSRPSDRPEILFISDHPGGDASDVRTGEHERWPDENQFAAASWKYAKKMRRLFDEDLLRNNMAMNAIFFRSPDAKVWKSNPKPIREELEAFSLGEALSIIQEARPKLVVVLGVTTLDSLTREVSVLLRTHKNHRLVVTASLKGASAIAIPNPTGAFGISHDDWDAAREAVDQIRNRL